jgi:Poxvirus P4B major core protein
MNTKESKGVDVGKLIRENASDAQVLAALRSKYPNDIEAVNKLFSEYDEKMSRIRRKAQKFAGLLLTHYSHLGPKRVVEKAKKYKQKYGFSDDEFNAFLNIALSDKSFSTANMRIPSTELSKTLGHTVDVPVKMMVKSSEYDVLQDILRMHQETVQLHTQAVIQALTYEEKEECKIMLYSKDPKDLFDSRKDNMYSNIHPVLFALFAPKIKDLEERMVLSSITSIVSARYNGTQFKTQPDWLLYHDLIQDPNESVCATSQKDSALTDLRNRARVQTELWKNVCNLRQGKFYPADATNFLVSLKACKNNYYDSPDLAFIEDEGSVLRRLLSVFSYRPTVVAVRNQAILSPFNAGMPLNNLAMSQITTVPMINIRLPVSDPTGNPDPVTLDESLTAPDFYVENKVIVPKIKEVVYSRGTLIFYINRRTFGFDHKKLVNPQDMPQFNVLPFSISGYESINDNPVKLDKELKLGKEEYNLKSLVSVETQVLNAGSPNATTFIKGCSATVLCGSGDKQTTNPLIYSYTNTLITYNPLNIDTATNRVTPIVDENYDPTQAGVAGPGANLSLNAGDITKFQKKVTIVIYAKKP